MKADCIYSGEQDFPFKFRILAIENLQVILTQYDEGATYNGFVTPECITRKVERKDDGHGAQGKKKKEKKKNEGLVITKLGKERKESFTGSVQHGDHGANGQLYTNLFKESEFKVLPYVITVTASIFYGCEQLTEKSSIMSKPIPFSFEPRWN
jgi:hypothetical protein